LVLSADTLEVGDIVVHRETNVPYVVMSLNLLRSSKVDNHVEVQEFDISPTDGTIVLRAGGASSIISVSQLRKKTKGYTIVPEHYTFTNV
jgi:hypothetical protein